MMEMTQEWITQFNKKCAEFMFPKAKEEYYSNADEISIEGGLFKKAMHVFEDYHLMRYHSDWNWIMEVVEAIEEKSSYTIMGRKVIGSFEISRYNIRLFFNPNQNLLLHLELRPYISEGTWKHPMYKYHIIKEFDFKGKSKKQAVIQAIDQFIDWYNKQKEL